MLYPFGQGLIWHVGIQLFIIYLFIIITVRHGGITKCDSSVYYKVRQGGITKYDS